MLRSDVRRSLRSLLRPDLCRSLRPDLRRSGLCRSGLLCSGLLRSGSGRVLRSDQLLRWSQAPQPARLVQASPQVLPQVGLLCSGSELLRPDLRRSLRPDLRCSGLCAGLCRSLRCLPLI